jgi:hypothetical protein
MMCSNAVGTAGSSRTPTWTESGQIQTDGLVIGSPAMQSLEA